MKLTTKMNGEPSPAMNIFFGKESTSSSGNAFVDSLTGQVNNETMQKIIEKQRECLWKFEKANEMMSNCTQLCEKRLVKVKKDAIGHNELIMQMKNDMDFIFKKIRRFKKSLSSEYPEVYNKVVQEQVRPSEDDDH